jgi:LysR family transcriptional regulator, malonate utilization transcriptional regulator
MAEGIRGMAIGLVGGGMGCTRLPGRMRATLPKNVQRIRLRARFSMRQTISADFLRTCERDPNVLALLATCRGYKTDID